MRLPWLLAALVLSILLLVAHLYALDHLWYWYHRWFDTPMHILGGAIAGLFFVGVVRKFRPVSYVFYIFAIAIGWEIFEYVFHISTGQPNYFLDTSHDVLNDTVGAVLVYILARFTLWRST